MNVFNENIFFSGEIEITLGYAIDYDDEIEEYEFNKDGLVKLLYGYMEWNQAKSIGYDWINMKFKKGKRVNSVFNRKT